MLLERVPIPESQLSEWSTHGSQNGSKRTHKTIRRALAANVWPDDLTYEFQLQGSYRNHTNIYGDSDVDMILKLNHTFLYDAKALSPSEQAELKKLPSAKYTWADFRSHAFKALNNKFGKSVVQGNKSIKIKADQSRLAADVVVCIEYRKYTSLNSSINGIIFYALQDKRWVVNYPEEHYKNGTAKNSRTENRYKQTVRMFKNARNYLVNTKKISHILAPSYFLECLIYNVPDDTFGSNFQDTYYSVLNWMNTTDINKVNCQNGQHKLFGTSAEQWSKNDAKLLFNHLTMLWNRWGERV